MIMRSILRSPSLASSFGAALLLSSLFVACGGGSAEDEAGGADRGAGGEESSTASGGGRSSGGAAAGTGGGETEAELDLGMDGAEALLLEGFPQTILSHNQKLLIAGSLGGDFWVARFDEAGEPDATFGAAGKAVVPFPAGESPVFPLDFDVAYALHPKGDALWVAGAVRGVGAGIESRWGLARLSADGELDASFQDDGVRVIDWTIGSRAYGVQEDESGRIYVSGTIENASTDMAVVRFLPTGESDTSFRLRDTGAGSVLSDGRYEEGLASVLLEDRYIVAGGPDFAAAAVDLDGKYLEDFGDSGWATPAPGNVYAMIRSGDSLLLAGPEPANEDSRSEAITIVKMGLDGALDESFGEGGVARLTYDFGSYVWPELEEQAGFQDTFVRVNGLTVLEDGSLLVSADALGFLVRYPVLLKATADGTLDPSFGQDGLVAFPVAMPLLAGAVPQPATRLASRGGVAWLVDEGVFSGGNRGFLIRAELERL